MSTPIQKISRIVPARFLDFYERWACDTRWIWVLGPKLKNRWLFVLNSQGFLPRGRLYTFKYRNGLDVLFRARTSDVLINVEVFGYEVYSQPFKDTSLQVNRCIDLGAQTGVFTLYALSQNKHMQVVCVEAIGENFEVLQKNIALNGFSSQAELHHKAAWGRSGESVTLQLSNQNTGGHSAVIDNSRVSTRVETVTTISLGDLVAGKPCQVLKIDIEGAEYEVLLNADKETLGLIEHIVGEVHGPQEQQDQLINFLKSHDFKVDSKDSTFWARRK